MKLTVALEPNEEEGYTAYVPSLPSCISEGDSRDEALYNIQEAIELYLEPIEDDMDHSPDSEITETENAIIFIQFTLVMAAWFEKEYTYIDWGLRYKLTDTGKAVHRFLFEQGKEYEIYTKKLMVTTGYLRGYKRSMADLRTTME